MGDIGINRRIILKWICDFYFAEIGYSKPCIMSLPALLQL
jgi:hypothetical protein